MYSAFVVLQLLSLGVSTTKTVEKCMYWCGIPGTVVSQFMMWYVGFIVI